VVRRRTAGRRTAIDSAGSTDGAESVESAEATLVECVEATIVESVEATIVAVSDISVSLLREGI
jgi:hypothetical protein